ncbi:hypothetical protein [Bradyrhizobium sp. Ash2021]|uniref:hypothetical protein n=1 Tax=Bradyrhizobium sp. Ash2021 TaxID=2954771 RepID=UPI002815B765|nr:hypothetical protein [Bradyrhizobium sp. Ash2021]WMT76281.1 hypothetical protein NL528_07885 [Bradyrhizobium sp. Ash2021]
MSLRRAPEFRGARAEGGGGAGAPVPSGRKPRHGVGKRGRRKTPKRVARRPDPDQWSENELLALHEAVALLWPRGPLTVSSLRTAIAKGHLGHARIAGRLYTTRAALGAMSECRRIPEGGRPSEADWEAHLASLLPGKGGRGG